MKIVAGQDVVVDIRFKELSEELQTKVYRANREKMAETAFGSVHYGLRIEVAKDATSPQFLKDILVRELKKDDVDIVIFAIIKNPNFEMSLEVLELLSQSDCALIRAYAAESNYATTEFLDKILKEEVLSHGDLYVVQNIMKNPSFDLSMENRELLSTLNRCAIRESIAKDINTPKKILDKMLKCEVEKEYFENLSVTKAIINNPNFTIDEKNKVHFAKSQYEEIRNLVLDK